MASALQVGCHFNFNEIMYKNLSMEARLELARSFGANVMLYHCLVETMGKILDSEIERRLHQISTDNW